MQRGINGATAPGRLTRKCSLARVRRIPLGVLCTLLIVATHSKVFGNNETSREQWRRGGRDQRSLPCIYLIVTVSREYAGIKEAPDRDGPESYLADERFTIASIDISNERRLQADSLPRKLEFHGSSLRVIN